MLVLSPGPFHRQSVSDCLDRAAVQVSHILPDPMDSKSVAALLRFGRGIDRQIVGNFMGKGDSLNQEVMHEYVRTFPFARMSFDSAFRAFADTFKQPPESQQVVRFTKNFVSAFLEAHGGDYRCACPGQLLADALPGTHPMAITRSTRTPPVFSFLHRAPPARGCQHAPSNTTGRAAVYRRVAQPWSAAHMSVAVERTVGHCMEITRSLTLCASRIRCPNPV